MEQLQREDLFVKRCLANISSTNEQIIASSIHRLPQFRVSFPSLIVVVNLDNECI